MTKPKLLILIGPPGSGKTYFAEQFSKRQHFVHINSDQVRIRYFENPTFTPAERKMVYRKIDELTMAELKAGNNTIFDGNLITNEDRKTALSKFSPVASVRFVFFDVPKHMALKRATSREWSENRLYKPMPLDRATIMHENFEPLGDGLPFVTVAGEYDVQEKAVLTVLE